MGRLLCLIHTVLHEKHRFKRTAPKVSKGRRLASGESAEGGSRKRSDDDRKALWGERLSSPVATKRKPNESAETSGLWPRRLRLRTRPQARILCLRQSNRFKREHYHSACPGSASCPARSTATRSSRNVRRAVSPRARCPAISSSLSASSTVRWITRRRGRAPYFAS